MNLTELKFWIIRIMIWSVLIPFVYGIGHLLYGSIPFDEVNTDYLQVVIGFGLMFIIWLGKDYLLGRWRNDFKVYDELQTVKEKQN